MTRRYSSISVQTALATSISNTALSAVVATGTASTLLGGITLTAGDVDQFKVIIDKDTASKEIMYVTGVTSDTLTIQRGKDGTSAVAHTGGATIEHVLTGEDLTYFTTGVVPTSDLATGLPFPGSTSGTNTLKAPAVTGTVTNTLPATTGTLMSAESVDAATSKSTPVDADEIPLADSAASFGLKKLTWANLKATLKTYFDTLYATVASLSGYIANTLLSTTGDMIYASAANTPARRGIGSTGDVLTVAGGVPTWAAPASTTTAAGVSAYCSATQNTTQNVATIIGLNTENFDTDTFHDTSTNNSRLTIPTGKDGKYHVTLTAIVNNTASAYGLLYKNGSAVNMGTWGTGRIAGANNTGANYAILDGSLDIALVAGDYLEVAILSDAATGANALFVTFSAMYWGA